jgi:hypothetical protein
MAIKINNVTAIDDSRNVSAGIVTVGSGSSATIINGTTGTVNIGTGITMVGSSGNISIAGTITAAGFNIPANITTFSPANGASVRADTLTSIALTFNQLVGIATTGTILIKAGAAGTTLQTIGISSIQSISNGYGVSIILNSQLGVSTIVPVIPNGLIKSTSGNFIGLNTTGANSYSFATRGPNLGEAFGGGYHICSTAGVRWIVAPNTSEVSRNWYSRTDSNARAQAVSGCTGWFVPNSGQLGNPGYICRTYWDSYSAAAYWSDTPSPFNSSCFSIYFNFGHGAGSSQFNANTLCVRSLRCVTY